MDEWYERMRDMPLNELGIGDLCRACRQRLFLDHTVPLLIERLALDPHGGELYDGELITVACNIPVEYWKTSLALLEKAKRMIMDALPEVDADVVEDVKAFVAKISTIE